MKLISSEHDEQAAFVQWVHLEYRNDPTFIEPFFFAIPNGMWAGGSGQNGKWGLITKFKQEGFKNGKPDLLYLQPRGPFSWLAIEMKRSDMKNKKDGGMKPEQIVFQNTVENWKYGITGLYKVCYSASEAQSIFSEYMQWYKERIK